MKMCKNNNITSNTGNSPAENQTLINKNMEELLFKDLQETEIFTQKFSSEWTEELLTKEMKWSDKKTKLEEFITYTKNIKIQKSSNRHHFIAMLLLLLKDSNINVVNSTILCINSLTLGLRENFKESIDFFLPLLEKFKDKNTKIYHDNLICLENFFYYKSLIFENVLINICEFLNKNEKASIVKERVCCLINNILKKTYAKELKKFCDPLAELLFKLSEDASGDVRNISLEVLGFIKGKIGEQAIAKFINEMNNIKKKKLDDAAEACKLDPLYDNEVFNHKQNFTNNNSNVLKNGSNNNINNSTTNSNAMDIDYETSRTNMIVPYNKDNKMSISSNSDEAQNVLGINKPQASKLVKSHSVNSLPTKNNLGSTSNATAANNVKTTNPSNVNRQVKELKKPEDNIDMEGEEETLNAEEVEKLIGSKIGQEITDLLVDAKWENRKNGFIMLKEKISEYPQEFNSCMDSLFKFIKIKLKDFKENNFNILKETFSVYETLIDKCNNFTRKFSNIIIKNYSEKIGDNKLKQSIINLLQKMFEFQSPKITTTNLIKHFTNNVKGVNSIKEFSAFLEKAIDEFGIGYFPVKEIADFSIYLANNVNPQIRNCATTLLCVLYKYTGEPLKKLLGDIKEATLNNINEEFKKITVISANDKKPAITVKCQEDANSSANEKNILESLISRVDISKKITPQLLKGLSEGKAKDKKEALTKIEEIIKTSKFIQPIGLNPLIIALKNNIGDGNKSFVRSLLQLYYILLECLGPGSKQFGKIILPGILNCLGDTQTLIKDDTLKLLQKWIELNGLDYIYNLANPYLIKDNFDLRFNLLTIIFTNKDKIDKCDIPSIIEGVLACLLDRNIKIKMLAEDLTSEMQKFIPSTAFQKAILKYKPEIQNSIKQIVDRYSANYAQRPIQDNLTNNAVSNNLNNNNLNINAMTINSRIPTQNANFNNNMNLLPNINQNPNNRTISLERMDIVSPVDMLNIKTIKIREQENDTNNTTQINNNKNNFNDLKISNVINNNLKTNNLNNMNNVNNNNKNINNESINSNLNVFPNKNVNISINNNNQIPQTNAGVLGNVNSNTVGINDNKLPPSNQININKNNLTQQDMLNNINNNNINNHYNVSNNLVQAAQPPQQQGNQNVLNNYNNYNNNNTTKINEEDEFFVETIKQRQKARRLTSYEDMQFPEHFYLLPNVIFLKKEFSQVLNKTCMSLYESENLSDFSNFYQKFFVIIEAKYFEFMETFDLFLMHFLLRFKKQEKNKTDLQEFNSISNIFFEFLRKSFILVQKHSIILEKLELKIIVEILLNIMRFYNYLPANASSAIIFESAENILVNLQSLFDPSLLFDAYCDYINQNINNGNAETNIMITAFTNLVKAKLKTFFDISEKLNFEKFKFLFLIIKNSKIYNEENRNKAFLVLNSIHENLQSQSKAKLEEFIIQNFEELNQFIQKPSLKHESFNNMMKNASSRNNSVNNNLTNNLIADSDLINEKKNSVEKHQENFTSTNNTIERSSSIMANNNNNCSIINNLNNIPNGNSNNNMNNNIMSMNTSNPALLSKSSFNTQPTSVIEPKEKNLQISLEKILNKIIISSIGEKVMNITEFNDRFLNDESKQNKNETTCLSMNADKIVNVFLEVYKELINKKTPLETYENIVVRMHHILLNLLTIKSFASEIDQTALSNIIESIITFMSDPLVENFNMSLSQKLSIIPFFYEFLFRLFIKGNLTSSLVIIFDLIRKNIKNDNKVNKLNIMIMNNADEIKARLHEIELDKVLFVIMLLFNEVEQIFIENNFNTNMQASEQDHPLKKLCDKTVKVTKGFLTLAVKVINDKILDFYKKGIDNVKYADKNLKKILQKILRKHNGISSDSNRKYLENPQALSDLINSCNRPEDQGNSYIGNNSSTNNNLNKNSVNNLNNNYLNNLNNNLNLSINSGKNIPNSSFNYINNNQFSAISNKSGNSINIEKEFKVMISQFISVSDPKVPEYLSNHNRLVKEKTALEILNFMKREKLSFDFLKNYLKDPEIDYIKNLSNSIVSNSSTDLCKKNESFQIANDHSSKISDFDNLINQVQNIFFSYI